MPLRGIWMPPQVRGLPRWYFGELQIWALPRNRRMPPNGIWVPPRVTCVAPRGIWVPLMGCWVLQMGDLGAHTHLDVLLHHVLRGVTQNDIKIQDPPDGAIGDGRGRLHDKLCKAKSPQNQINALFLKYWFTGVEKSGRGEKIEPCQKETQQQNFSFIYQV